VFIRGGKNLRGGEAPLSSSLPSPAINICQDLSMLQAGEGFTLVPFMVSHSWRTTEVTTK